MSLVEAIKDVTEQENKALGVETPAPVEKEVPAANDETPTEDSASGANRDKGGKFKKAEGDEKPAVKKTDEAKKPAAAAEEPAAADDSAPEGPAAWARLRREKAEAERQRIAAERRAEAAESRFNQSPTQPQPGPAKVEAKAAASAAVEPDPNTDPEGHLRWELAQTRAELKEVADWKAQQTHREQQVSLKSNAVKAFEGYEKDFAPTVEDYADVMDFGVNALSQSIRTLNPNLSGEALGEAIQRQVLRLAAQAEAKGEDPAESLYNLARSWGYKPKAADPQPKTAVEDVKKPTVKDIAGHKKRSASSLTAGGKNGSAPLSRDAVLSKDFGLQDFAKLSPSQLRELEGLEG